MSFTQNLPGSQNPIVTPGGKVIPPPPQMPVATGQTMPPSMGGQYAQPQPPPMAKPYQPHQPMPARPQNPQQPDMQSMIALQHLRGQRRPMMRPRPGGSPQPPPIAMP